MPDGQPDPPSTSSTARCPAPAPRYSSPDLGAALEVFDGCYVRSHESSVCGGTAVAFEAAESTFWPAVVVVVVMKPRLAHRLAAAGGNGRRLWRSRASWQQLLLQPMGSIRSRASGRGQACIATARQ